MKLTTKGRYAVLALTDLAMEGDKGFVKISHIAVRQNISSTYLEQILLKGNKFLGAQAFLQVRSNFSIVRSFLLGRHFFRALEFVSFPSRSQT